MNSKKPSDQQPDSPNFDWDRSPLNTSTIITADYKNTAHVKAFFTSEIGEHFHFTFELMNWMNRHTGKTLGEAINTWDELRKLKKDSTFNSEIASQFEYNRYIRAFMADNKGKILADAIKYWKLKRVAGGTKIYERADLGLE